MTVRIIEEQPDQSVVKQIICKNCGVKLEYVPADIKIHRYTDYDGGSDAYQYITCLKCNDKVVVRR